MPLKRDTTRLTGRGANAKKVFPSLKCNSNIMADGTTTTAVMAVVTAKAVTVAVRVGVVMVDTAVDGAVKAVTKIKDTETTRADGAKVVAAATANGTVTTMHHVVAVAVPAEVAVVAVADKSLRPTRHAC